ncbi:MAG: ribonuclease T(2) [Mycolicibacterium rufum]|nr:ribonuclease T(2) [Mycolicibacterium rufum]
MRRGDAAVLSISAALGAVVVAAVVFSGTVLDRNTDPAALVSEDASSLLVLTWAPSFCAGEGDNPACASGEVAKAGQTLLLHGLWPQPRDRQYCGVPQDQRARESGRPPVQLSDDTRERLQSATVNTASLAQHEWYAHGTCSGVSPDDYFDDAVRLAEQARTVLDPVLRDAAGGRLTLATVRARVDEALGAGTGDRVGLGCRSSTGAGTMVVDIRLSLPPVVDLGTADGTLTLMDALHKGPPLAAQCRHGSVP